MHEYSLKFIIGIILLITNIPLGWGGLVFCAYLGRKTKKKFYYWLGTVLYILSWIMLALGGFLAGPEGIKLAKNVTNKYRWESVIAAVLIIIGIFIYGSKKKNKKEIIQDKN